MTDAVEYRGCEIPPDVHRRVFGWDPTPEIERLLFIAAEHGCRPRTALEIGCGTGRLLRPLAERGVEVHGLELSTTAAAYARDHSGCPVIVGDMSDFSTGRRFDMVHASANTIRHVNDERMIAGMWRSIREALRPNGLFVADLEFGLKHEAAAVGKEAAWIIEHGETSYRGVWKRVAPPCSTTRRVMIEWRFERRAGRRLDNWSERFELRVYESHEFFAYAAAAGLTRHALYEPRDPFILSVKIDGFSGRGLAVAMYPEAAGRADDDEAQ